MVYALQHNFLLRSLRVDKDMAESLSQGLRCVDFMTKRGHTEVNSDFVTRLHATTYIRTRTTAQHGSPEALKLSGNLSLRTYPWKREHNAKARNNESALHEIVRSVHGFADILYSKTPPVSLEKVGPYQYFFYLRHVLSLYALKLTDHSEWPLAALKKMAQLLNVQGFVDIYQAQQRPYLPPLLQAQELTFFRPGDSFGGCVLVAPDNVAPVTQILTAKHYNVLGQRTL